MELIDKLTAWTTGRLLTECAKMGIATWRKAGAWYYLIPGQKPCGPHSDMRAAYLNALYNAEEKK